MPSQDPHDPVLVTLAELLTVLRETSDQHHMAIRRAGRIRQLRAQGHRYGDIVPMEKRPLIVELITDHLSDLSQASGRFRKAEARALYAEGMTMEEIGQLFGVTRQRIAVLLRSENKDDERGS